MMPWIDDLNIEGDIGNTLLHYAALNNRPEMAKFLMPHGADAGKGNDYGDTPIDLMEGNDAFSKF